MGFRPSMPGNFDQRVFQCFRQQRRPEARLGVARGRPDVGFLVRRPNAPQVPVAFDQKSVGGFFRQETELDKRTAFFMERPATGEGILKSGGR